MIRKIIKKIRKRTKINEKKLEFKNKNIYDFKNFDNENANNDR